MNDINSKEFKKKYLKSKIKLRQWENEFFTENGRLPTKVDIKASPASVKEYYKLYWNLKTQILEAEILGEDKLREEAPSLIRSKSDSVLKEHTNTLSHSEPGQDKIKNWASSTKSNSTETWGSHLNRKPSEVVTEKEKCTLLNETIAGRLFKGSSFKKRNPRKSLSFSKKKNSVPLEDSKSIESPDVSSILSPYSDLQHDEQSVNGSVFSVESDCSPNIKALITSSASLSPLLGKPENVCAEKTSIPVQPVSLIQVVASNPSAILKPRSLDAGWVQRCAEIERKEERKSMDSGFESMEFSQVFEGSKVNDSSDDDLIAGSDNELDQTNRFSCSFVSQKRKAKDSSANENPEPPKRIKIDSNSSPEVTEKPRTKEEIKKVILERKIETGKLNENFVKINLKKKVYVRGKKNFNFAKYKKKEWKNKKKSLGGDGKESGGVVQCFKCGETGHFSRYCHKQEEDKLMESAEDEEDELPSLEEAEKMAREKAGENHCKRINLNFAKNWETESPAAKVKPLYEVKGDGSLVETPAEVYEALNKFGHSSFRPGQEETIMRILSGQSTLLTVATGGGKSLCYQLPAYLYASQRKCITLVVSPLVSLMEDQVSGSSSFFKIGCLHTGQTSKQRETVVEDAKSGKLYALLVSPEAVVSSDFSGFGNVFRHLPPIAFACIDEVHCVSQWSHNFRPSYLMISKVLKEKLGVSTVLGLTATATLSTVESVTRELGIDRETGVIRDVPLPDNLRLTVSREESKDEALIQVLKSPRFADANSILIYCTRRDECERLAVYVRTRLQDPAVRSGKSCRSLPWNAESYHAGMAAARRKQVQKAFMRGNLRIVVATVAFGMGINKQDIRGVIHYNMPKDFESYVQEAGRAGRDGEPAFCHLFLDPKGRDLNELRRHIHADSVDRHVLRKLLQRVFVECECKKSGKTPCEGHEIAFDCSETIQALDLPEENIHTLLCYLELNEKKFIKVLSPAYMKCKVKSYKGMKEIVAAARKCPPLAYACAAAAKENKKEKSETLSFDAIDVANQLGWDSGVVKSQLKGAEWTEGADGRRKKTALSVEFQGLGFRVCSRGDMTPSELDEALDFLIQRVEAQEKRAKAQLDVTYSAFHFFAKDSFSPSLEDFDEHSSTRLKQVIEEFFNTERLPRDIPIKQFQVEEFDEDQVASDIRTLICTYRDNAFNGRAVARIFHGIQSPNYPAALWHKCKFWRSHVDKDFNKICRLATIEILRLKK